MPVQNIVVLCLFAHLVPCVDLLLFPIPIMDKFVNKITVVIYSNYFSSKTE
jgi:hypothetical protein